MGTRADFYVGTGVDAEWLGSIAWDGYPEGILPSVLSVHDEADYRANVGALLAGRPDGTSPDQGWPWPWEDSTTTDFAYCFVSDHVDAFAWGCGPLDPLWPEEGHDDPPKCAWPDMSKKAKVTLGPRSGVIVMTN